MKQIVQPLAGGPVEVLDVPRPVPDATEVLVRTVASVISPGTERAATALAQASLLVKARGLPDLVRQVVKKARAGGHQAGCPWPPRRGPTAGVRVALLPETRGNQPVPRALITGITGQDGLYLGEFLTAKGYEVFGMVRGQSNPKIPTVEEHIPSIQLVEGDLRDLSSLIGVLETAQPDEIYNLGAISFVGLSFKQPELTGDITGMGVLRMLEAIRIHRQGSMDGSPVLSGVEFRNVRYSAGVA